MRYFTVVKPHWALIRAKQIASASKIYFNRFGYEPEEVKLVEMADKTYSTLQELLKAADSLQLLENEDVETVIMMSESASKLMNERVEDMKRIFRGYEKSEKEIALKEAFMRDMGFVAFHW